METIRQDGKIILHGNDGISIKMIFKNLTGKNFQGREYADYIYSRINSFERGSTISLVPPVFIESFNPLV